MTIFWIEAQQPPRLAIVARPRGGDKLEEDLAALRTGGIDVLVSLLEPGEADDLGLRDEAAVAERLGLRFISWPIADRCAPADRAAFQKLVSDLAALVRAGKSIAAHCRGCIGRSTVVIASVMIALGEDATESLRVIEQARGCAVPDTAEQLEWLLAFRPHASSHAGELAFPHSWQADILPQRPLILPPSRFTYPREAEEVERGALEIRVRPAGAAPFLATFALGFADPAAPTGLWSCPHPDQLCALAGGYAYIVDTQDPARFTHLDFRPVLEVRPLPEHNLLLFAGHYALLAWGPERLAWQSPRLSSEGLRLTGVRGDAFYGYGWDLLTDREIPFAVDLKTGDPRAGRFA